MTGDAKQYSPQCLGDELYQDSVTVAVKGFGRL